MLLSNLDANTERLMSCNEFCGTRLFSASLACLFLHHVPCISLLRVHVPFRLNSAAYLPCNLSERVFCCT